MKFTAKDLLHKKSFIYTNIFLIVLILIGVNIPNIMNYFESDESNLVLIIDEENIYSGLIENVNSYGLSVEYEILNEFVAEEKINELISNNTYEYVIQINLDETVNFTYYTSDLYAGEADAVTTILQSLYVNLKISELNLSEEDTLSINPVFTSEFICATENEVMNYSNYVFAYILSIVLFYAIYFYAVQVSSSVTTEKTSKIIELILTSTDAKSVIIGKTMGIGIVGFCQIIILSVIAVGSAYIFIPGDVISTLLQEISITPFLLLIVLFYFTCGYLLFSFMFALTGAMVTRIEDIQMANGPVSIIAVLSFYLAFFTMNLSDGILYEVAKFLPFSSSFMMPVAYVSGNVSFTDLIVSSLLLIFTVIVVAKISIKIYKSAILNFGSKLSIKGLLKAYNEK